MTARPIDPEPPNFFTIWLLFVLTAAVFLLFL